MRGEHLTEDEGDFVSIRERGKDVYVYVGGIS